MLTIIGPAFKDLKPNALYYPSIGMKKPNEALRANFGQEPFAFDIDSIVQGEKATIQQEIALSKGQPREHGSTDETQFIQSLIGQYLAHDGYVEAARAFAGEVMEEAQALAADGQADVPYLQTEEDIDAINRQRKNIFHYSCRIAELTIRQVYAQPSLTATSIKLSNTQMLTTPPYCATTKTSTSSSAVASSSR
jgi:hypothetical protein